MSIERPKAKERTAIAAKCRKCGEAITYTRTAKDGGMVANNPDGSNHLSTCPFADQSRRVPYQGNLFT